MQERRKERRYPDINRVHIEYPSLEEVQKTSRDIEFALTENLSMGGSKILCDVPPPVSAVLKMKYHLRLSDKFVDMLSIVRWVTHHDDDLCEFGVEHFTTTDELLIHHLLKIGRGATS